MTHSSYPLEDRFVFSSTLRFVLRSYGKRGPLNLIFRSLSLVVLLSTLFAVTPKIHAQTAVYGTGMSAAFGFRGDDYPNGTSLKPDTTGFTSGVFYLFPSLTRFKSGIDGRVTYSPGYNGGKAYTGGFRFSFVPYRFPLRPYVQFGGGAASTQLHESACSTPGCATKTVQITGGVVQLDAGLDVRLTQHFDLRAIDFGTDEGGSRGLTSAATRFYSAGFVFHFGAPRPTRP